MQSEAWEQKLMETVQSQLDTAGADTCRGVKGVVESLVGARRVGRTKPRGSRGARLRGSVPARIGIAAIVPPDLSPKTCAPLRITQGQLAANPALRWDKPSGGGQSPVVAFAVVVIGPS